MKQPYALTPKHPIDACKKKGLPTRQPHNLNLTLNYEKTLNGLTSNHMPLF